MTGQLIVSVSGIRDETAQVVADFAAQMDRRAVPLSLLVAPRLKDEYRLVAGASRGARRGRPVRLAISAKQLGRTGPRQALLDAVDVALLHRATPDVYRWPPRDGAREVA